MNVDKMLSNPLSVSRRGGIGGWKTTCIRLEDANMYKNSEARKLVRQLLNKLFFRWRKHNPNYLFKNIVGFAVEPILHNEVMVKMNFL